MRVFEKRNKKHLVGITNTIGHLTHELSDLIKCQLK